MNYQDYIKTELLILVPVLYLVGIGLKKSKVADKWIPAQKLLGISHGIAGAAMTGAAAYCMSSVTPEFGVLFPLYAISVAFYMPTIELSNSVAFKVLADNGYDTVKDFPPIRVFGTVGFICAMLFVNFMTNGAGVQYQHSYNQFIVSGVLGLAMLITGQALLHIMVTVNILPETGQPLPLISRGGSSLLFTSAGLGMILGVSRQIIDGLFKED